MSFIRDSREKNVPEIPEQGHIGHRVGLKEMLPYLGAGPFGAEFSFPSDGDWDFHSPASFFLIEFTWKVELFEFLLSLRVFLADDRHDDFLWLRNVATLDNIFHCNKLNVEGIELFDR